LQPSGYGMGSPRGPVAIDPMTRDIVQNEYIRRVEKVNGELYNVKICRDRGWMRSPLSETYAKVSLSCAKLTPAVRFLLL
jgi:hypothetical protein